MTSFFGIAANISAILTAIVAVFGYSVYRWDQCQKRIKLEQYLKDQKNANVDKGQRSLLHLMAKLGLTEAELLQSSFRSKNIHRRVAADDKTGRAEALLLEWQE